MKLETILPSPAGQARDMNKPEPGRRQEGQCWGCNPCSCLECRGLAGGKLPVGLPWDQLSLPQQVMVLLGIRCKEPH